MQKQNIFKTKNKLTIALLSGVMLLAAAFGSMLGGSLKASAAAAQSGYWDSSNNSGYWSSAMTAPLTSRNGAATDISFTEAYNNLPYGHYLKNPSTYNVWYDVYGVSLRTKIGGVWYVQDYYDVDKHFSTTGSGGSFLNLSQYFNFIVGQECEVYAYAIQKYSGVFYRSNIIKFTPEVLIDTQITLAPSASITYHNVTSTAGYKTSYTRLESVTLPTPPNQNDYAFDGWYTNSGLTGSAVTSISSGSGGNKVFYAKWKYVYDLVPLPPDPSKNGYTFVGWYYDAGLTQAYDGAPIYSNTQLYAKFNPITYSVTYNTNGGSLSGQTTSYTIETNNITFPTPTKNGYSFEGWFENSNFTGSAITGIAKGSIGNKTVYAKFTPIVYSITYNTNDGTISGQTTSYTIESNNITYPSPTKTGYTFNGWYENSSFTGSAVTGVSKGSTGNKTVYAKFTAINYTISYNLNGGEMTGQTAAFTIESGAIALPTPTRTGYEFKGWYDNAALNGLAVMSIPSGSTGNKTYYAKWEILKYTITFYVDGEVYSEMLVEYGTLFNEFYLVNKSTLEVVPLYLNAEMTAAFDLETAITQSMAVYTSSDFVIFVSLTYIVDDEEIASDLLEYNAPLNSLRTPEADGLDFAGWFYDKEYTKPVSATDKLTSNVTIYAKLTDPKIENPTFWQKVGAWFSSTGGVITTIIIAAALVLGGIGYGVHKKKKS